MWYNKYPKHMKEQTMKKLITLIMTFLLCLGSVSPTFAADKKKGFDASAKHAMLLKQLPVRFYTKKMQLPLLGLALLPNF